MHFAVVGISYKSAPIEVREDVVFTDTKKMEMYEKLNQAGVEESVILSTCNRSEIYFIYQYQEQIDDIKAVYEKFFLNHDLTDYLFEKKDEDALFYLFQVTNGLDSLVVGEDQILGQVVQAEEFSRVNGCSKKIMNHIFRDAVTCAKKAKTEYKISEIPLSLSYIGMKQLESSCGINEKVILVLGSGKMSRLAMQYLYEKKPKIVYNANRSRERAEGLKKEFPALQIITYSQIKEVTGHCDIIIGATSSPHVIIKKEDIPAVLEKDLFLIDLASPRDFDPDLKDKKHVYLYDMDCLAKIAEENNRIRLSKADGITELIKEELKETMHWILSSKVDKTIQTLQEKVDVVSNDTFLLLEKKLDLNEHQKAILKKVLKSSMKRLIREPIISLKQVEEKQQDQYHEVVKNLFHLEE